MSRIYDDNSLGVVISDPERKGLCVCYRMKLPGIYTQCRFVL